MGLELIVVGALAGASLIEQNKANKANKQARAQQGAQNAAESARERRQQVREERIRRAQILQSSENSGTTGSSGSIGAQDVLSTNLSSNIGTNMGRINSANQISIFQQKAADAMFMSSVFQTAGSFAAQGNFKGGKGGIPELNMEMPLASNTP